MTTNSTSDNDGDFKARNAKPVTRTGEGVAPIVRSWARAADESNPQMAALLVTKEAEAEMEKRGIKLDI